jgi:hypothetical protein
VQVPEQLVSPLWQLRTHTLLEQMCPEEHAFRHDPQFWSSEVRSRQTPKQLVVPGGQLAEHVPFTHTDPDGQTTPQPPQLWSSDWRLVHTPWQAVSVVWQLRTQLPLEQICPGVHALPHVPQFWSSRCRLTHERPHATVPPLHLSFLLCSAADASVAETAVAPPAAPRANAKRKKFLREPPACPAKDRATWSNEELVFTAFAPPPLAPRGITWRAHTRKYLPRDCSTLRSMGISNFDELLTVKTQLRAQALGLRNRAIRTLGTNSVRMGRAHSARRRRLDGHVNLFCHGDSQSCHRHFS